METPLTEDHHVRSAEASWDVLGEIDALLCHELSSFVLMYLLRVFLEDVVDVGLQDHLHLEECSIELRVFSVEFVRLDLVLLDELVVLADHALGHTVGDGSLIRVDA